jgi:hypothetical protein
MKPGTIPLHIQAPLSAPINSRRIIEGITGDMLDMNDSSICFQVILYTPMPIAAAIPAETRSVSWLAPERVSTPNAITENDSIIIKDAMGMSESQIEGIGISLQGALMFIFSAVWFWIDR